MERGGAPLDSFLNGRTAGWKPALQGLRSDCLFDFGQGDRASLLEGLFGGKRDQIRDAAVVSVDGGGFIVEDGVHELGHFDKVRFGVSLQEEMQRFGRMHTGRVGKDGAARRIIFSLDCAF